MPEPNTVLILGAAGRDFHNFNVVFRDDPAARVVAFTAAQILENAVTVLEAVGRSKPSTFKGSQFIRSVTLSSSMSPGVKVASTEFSKY